jgi:hypothetical protein
MKTFLETIFAGAAVLALLWLLLACAGFWMKIMPEQTILPILLTIVCVYFVGVPVITGLSEILFRRK